MPVEYLVFDYETFSEADLKKLGAWEYSVHPSTEILCLAYRFGTRDELRNAPTNWWTPGRDLSKFLELLYRPEVIATAHNSYFENVITHNVLPKYVKKKINLPPERWLCTASLAAALALPRNLEGAADALKLSIRKDLEGRKLMLKYCKPKKPSKKDPSTRHTNPIELARIVEYCKTDVDTEVELFLRIPLLTPTERRVWLLDQKINLNGFAVDRPFVTTVLKMIDDETNEINRRTRELTNGEVRSATQRAAVLDFVNANGVSLPDLRKGTVDEVLKSEGLSGPAREILEYRQAISKTSTAKYEAFERRSRFDGRCRDILMYHAATTGRWGGVGVQPQNLPRASIKDTNQAAEVLAEGDLEIVRMLYGSPMKVFSDCIRSCIVAPPGKVLDAADYAAIEARVLFWVAKHDEGLRAFREGRDLYVEQASKVFNKPIDKIAKDSFERFIGKGLVLGCGYQMGPDRFAETCLMQGREVSEELAQAAVRSYRETHRPVVMLWSNIEKAAIAAVENLGKKFTVNRTSWYVRNNFLFCELPSGRRLAYREPSVRWGYKFATSREKSPILYHFNVDSLSRKWVETKTYGGRLVENVVQAIARDLMAEAMLRIDEAGWDIVLSVHDELIAERDLFSDKTNADFCRLMATLPPWGEGIPVVAEGWSGPRYRK